MSYRRSMGRRGRPGAAVWTVAFVLTPLASGVSVQADTIRVPQDYATIQQGIDAADPGDAVVFANGTHTGLGNTNVDFGGKRITVRSESGDPSGLSLKSRAPRVIEEGLDRGGRIGSLGSPFLASRQDQPVVRT